MSDVVLHLGDCLSFMRTLEDGAVDAVVTDPPYGIGESSKRNSTRSNLAPVRDYGVYTWDTERLPAAYITELLRVSREQVIFGGNYYTDMLPPSPSWIVWDKQNGANDFADCELAWTSHNRACRKFTWTWNGFIRQQPEERYHPTQKPLALMTWIIQNYTPEGATILDPFAGSFTTGVACILTGRKFIGIEKDQHYFGIGKKRIEQALAQPSLFSCGTAGTGTPSYQAGLLPQQLRIPETGEHDAPG